MLMGSRLPLLPLPPLCFSHSLGPGIPQLLLFFGQISYSLFLLHVPIGGKVINLSLRFVHTTPGKLVVLADRFGDFHCRCVVIVQICRASGPEVVFGNSLPEKAGCCLWFCRERTCYSRVGMMGRPSSGKAESGNLESNGGRCSVSAVESVTPVK